MWRTQGRVAFSPSLHSLGVLGQNPAWDGGRDGIWEYLEQEGDCKGAKSDTWGMIREQSWG